MPFDFLAWMIGFGLSRTGNKGLDRLHKSNLTKEISADIDSWVAETNYEVPPGDLNPRALFFEFKHEFDASSRPALERLRSLLEDCITPEDDVWYSALFEQWSFVKSSVGTGGQAFFQLPAEQASPRLRDLGKRMGRTCRQEPDFAFNTLITNLLANKSGAINEGQIAEQLITYVEDKRLLYYALERELPIACYKSAESMRICLTDFMKATSRQSEVFTQVEAIRDACADFMGDLESLNLQGKGNLYRVGQDRVKKFNKAIDKLRLACSVPLRKICDSYSITPSEHLNYVMAVGDTN